MKRTSLFLYVVLVVIMIFTPAMVYSGVTAVINLPATGQVTSYAPGDDGDLQMGVSWPGPRFTCGASTCTDNLTGLVWMQNANCIGTQYPGDDTDDTSGDGKVTWSSGRDFLEQMNQGNRPNCAAGQNDWRIPNINEIHSLLNRGASDIAGWLTSQGFQNVQSDNYWVSTSYSVFTGSGWVVRIGTNSFDIIHENLGQWGGSRNAHIPGPAWWPRDLDPPDCYNCSFPYMWFVRGGPDNTPDPTWPANLHETGQRAGNWTWRGTDGYVNTGSTPQWPGRRGISWPTSGNSGGSGRFDDNLDGTMTDLLTGLMWTQSGTVGLTTGAGGNTGAIYLFDNVFDFIDDMNTGNNGRCTIDSSTLPRCYPFENSCGPGNNLPCPLPKTDCPTGLVCIGAVEASPWNSNPPVGAAYGDCQYPSIDIPCNIPSDCPAIVGGEFPGTYNNLCVAIPNYGYTDWRLPNIVELRSLVNYHVECNGGGGAGGAGSECPTGAGADAVYGIPAGWSYLNWEGFTDITEGASHIPRKSTAGYWSSTTDGSDQTRAYTLGLFRQGGVSGTFEKANPCTIPPGFSGVYPCASWGPNPEARFFWPVRTNGGDDGDGVSIYIEDDAPNNGDGNADGIQDYFQPLVTSLPSAAGFVTVVTDGTVGGCTQNMNVQTAAASPADPGFSYPLGVAGFEIRCATGPANMKIIFHGSSDLTGMAYRNYGSTGPAFGAPAWYEMTGVSFSTEFIGGQTVATASFQIFENQMGDHDPLGNLILSLGGPGLPAPPMAIPTMTQWGMVAFMLLAVAGAVYYLRRRKTV